MACIADVAPVPHLLMSGHTLEADVLSEVLLTKPFRVADLGIRPVRAAWV